ncbi:MAG: hypothetical protein N2749_07120 [Clostridia bacterium]|nr:hypothetical protein [Clostridia bacterium]
MNNNKFLYVLSGNGVNGIAYINREDGKNVEFKTCKYNIGVGSIPRNVQLAYPQSKIGFYKVDFSEEGVPYAIYVVLNKKGLIGKYTEIFFVSQNLINGELAAE